MVNGDCAVDGLQAGPIPSGIQSNIWETEHELESSQPRLPPPLLAKLESELHSLHMELQPGRVDYEARKMAVNFVDSLAREKLSYERGGYHARPLGSYVMDIFTRDSDLDISVNLNYENKNHKREEGIRVLKKLMRSLFVLRDGGIVRDVVPIFRAKVPVLKFTHCRTGIECDVSVENQDGVIKSELLKVFSSIDPRFRKMCFLMKYWANVNMINSSKHQTLNSLSIILLVAIHLQTRAPAILPPFSALLEGMGSSYSLSTIRFAQNQAQKYRNFGKRNKETIAELFRSFFLQMMAAKGMWKHGLRASTYVGTWSIGAPNGLMFVEDFTQPSQNAARAVNMVGFESIYSCIEEALVQIKDYALGVQGVYSLRQALFSNCLSNQKKRSLQNALSNASDDALPSCDRLLTEFIPLVIPDVVPGTEKGKQVDETPQTQKRIRLMQTVAGDDYTATKHGMYQNRLHERNNPLYHIGVGQSNIDRFPPLLAGVQSHRLGRSPHPPLNVPDQRRHESYLDTRLRENFSVPVWDNNMLENTRKRFHPFPEPGPLYRRPHHPRLLYPQTFNYDLQS